MIDEKNALQIINKYLNYTNNSLRTEYFPIINTKLYSDIQLCNDLIDFLGDLYVCLGLNENYEENDLGAEIQQGISYLAFVRGKTEDQLGR